MLQAVIRYADRGSQHPVDTPGIPAWETGAWYRVPTGSVKQLSYRRQASGEIGSVFSQACRRAGAGMFYRGTRQPAGQRRPTVSGQTNRARCFYAV